MISRCYNDLLACHFGIDKICKLIARMYYQPKLCKNMKASVWGCNVCFTSKVVRHKSYNDLQYLQVKTYHWKNLLIDFNIGLPITTDWKKNSYNVILITVNRLTKMVYYEPVKTTTNVTCSIEVIIHTLVSYYWFFESINSDQGSVFSFNFWSLLCYFFGMKWKLYTIFYL